MVERTKDQRKSLRVGWLSVIFVFAPTTRRWDNDYAVRTDCTKYIEYIHLLHQSQPQTEDHISVNMFADSCCERAGDWRRSIQWTYIHHDHIIVIYLVTDSDIGGLQRPRSGKEDFYDWWGLGLQSHTRQAAHRCGLCSNLARCISLRNGELKSAIIFKSSLGYDSIFFLSHFPSQVFFRSLNLKISPKIPQMHPTRDDFSGEEDPALCQTLLEPLAKHPLRAQRGHAYDEERCLPCI